MSTLPAHLPLAHQLPHQVPPPLFQVVFRVSSSSIENEDLIILFRYCFVAEVPILRVFIGT